MDYTQAQQELVKKLNAHDLSQFQTILLIIISALPIPMDWREHILVYIFNPTMPWSGLHIPFPHLTTFQFGILGLILIILSPVIGFLLGWIVLLIANFIFRTLLPAIFGKSVSRFIPKQENTFLEVTFPTKTYQSSYSTEQLFNLIHSLSRKNASFLKSLIGIKKTYSLEITSSRDDGIKFIIATPPKDAEILRGGLLSYLPTVKVKVIPDYLAQKYGDGESYMLSIFDLKLSNHFAYPLKDQKILEEHDPISFLTGMMTKLNPSELISFQIVTTPVLSNTHKRILNKIKKIRQRIREGKPIGPILTDNIFLRLTELPGAGILILVFKAITEVMLVILKFIATIPISILSSSGSSSRGQVMPIMMTNEFKVDPQAILNPYEKQITEVVKEKIDQNLFESTLRCLIVVKDDSELEKRIAGITSSFASFDSTYQTIVTKGSLLSMLPLPRQISAKIVNSHLQQFIQRSLSSNGLFNQNPILSTSEISDIYHLPFTSTTKTEGLVKHKSNELPAPLSKKKSGSHLDVVMGLNTYGGELTEVGLSEDERKQHTYIVGKTGQGKSSLIKNMAYQDIVNGKGIAVIDPHGDMIQELLTIIPKKRIKDVYFVNLSDKDYPVGLNLLLPEIKFKDEDEQKERITGTLMSIFQKITPKEHWGQRMEHILRNTLLTSLEIKTPSSHTPYLSLLTIQKLLTDLNYLKEVSEHLTDPILREFWEKQFLMYGSMQKSSVTSPLTNRLGEFITSKQSRNILLQEKSTINIQKIMNEGKILLVNLSKGELGEDRSNFFGTLIISLIQLAAYSRASIPESKRRNFYLYIDEFQNFATEHFTDIFSEARKYHLFIIPAHQNIAQIDDPKLSKVVLSNSGNIIAFKNGPDDEHILLPFLEPEVEKGAIVNLPPHHFFAKVTNDDNEDAFSGETQLLDIKGSEKTAKEVIAYSRKHYATKKEIVEKQFLKLFTTTKAKIKKETKDTTKNNKKNAKLSKTKVIKKKKRVV